MSNKQVRKARHEIMRSPAFSVPKDTDADAIARELARIAKAQGSLTAEAVVNAASEKSSAMHALFTWDDDAAAAKWRLHQARNIIRAVQVVVDDQPSRSVYVHVGQRSAYQPMERVVERADLYALALAAAHVRLNAAAAALGELRLAAEGAADGEQMAKISMAISALETARNVAQSLH
jgi:hypothetical protein